MAKACSLFVLALLDVSHAARKLRDAPPFAPGVAVERGGDHLRRPRVYPKGELSKGTMDRQWPHQVAQPAARCSGGNHVTIRLFCEGLSLCPRTHSFRRDDEDILVFCFAEHAHAEQFRERFGGEFH
jgi:hypothetical protein